MADRPPLVVVLDESILIGALRTEEEPSNRRYRFAALALACVQVMHRIALSPAVQLAYQHQMGRHGPKSSGGLASLLVRSARGLLADSDRFLWVEAPPTVAGSYDPNDQHVVSLAASVPGSVLVANDDPLLGSLDAEGVCQRHGFTACHAEASLSVLGMGEAIDAIGQLRELLRTRR